MISDWLPGRSRFDVPCRVEVEHTHESLHAHVEFAEDVEIRPGDEVIVHGDPIHVPFGSKAVLDRLATVRRASALERAWTRMTGSLEFSELYDISFSHGRPL